MGAFKDLTGQKFSRLTVLERAEDHVSPKGNHYVQWLCKCECGNTTIVRAISLTSEITKSCGCLSKEIAHTQAIKNFKKQNSFEICDRYVTMYTLKNEPFYIDLEDFDKVKSICWWRRKDGYILGRLNGKTIRLHRYVTNCPSEYEVDHRNHDKSDNRKENLRIVTRSQNSMNKGLQSNNTSGVTGVCWDTHYQKWVAQIRLNNKNIRLGSFENFDDAIKVRQEAEEKYFGEYSYKNSQKHKLKENVL